MTEKLEADCFEIDIDYVYDACGNRHKLPRDVARGEVVWAVIHNLTQESKKRFEEYQEKNNPCKEVE